MRLLISVVSVAEARDALAGAADVIDVKNPAEGALGAPTPSTLRAIRRALPSTTSLSVALGDAPHLPGTLALAAHGAGVCGVDFVKVGLLGSSSPREAVELLTAVRRATGEADPGVGMVAVAYADAARASGLPHGELPRVAAAAEADGVLLDTLIKDGVSTFDALEEAAVAGFVREARALGLFVGLAGSLGPADVQRAHRLGADLIGFRGAACEGGRDGVIRAAKVRALRDVVRLTRPAPPGRAPGPGAPGAGPGRSR